MAPLVFAAAIFFTVLLFIMGAYYLYDHAIYGDQATTVRRLRAQGEFNPRATAVEIVRRDAMSQEAWYTTILGRVAPLAAIKRLLKQADSEMPVSVFLLLTSIFFIAGALIGLWLRLGPIVTGGLAMAGGLAPLMYQRRRRAIRLKKIEAQLPEALDLIARTLLAGHAFIMGLKMVGDQMEDPVRAEFKKTFDEISFGVSVADSMKELSERVDSVDIKFFVTSLLVQLETGGNLAEIIQGISRLIRARFELHGKVRALSAEGRISAIVMFSLPFLLGMALYYINPTYMSLLFTDPAGKAMLTGGFLMMMFGMFVTRRMVQIKV
ncbi:MAG TPA: type II secretion system F family protein [Candidatus Limnocylindrales bacterium]|nr:type II secretion system F family protein [Candidatus Limnocylindrales bacterium]